MSEIIVSISELKQLVQDMQRTGCDIVNLSISDPDVALDLPAELVAECGHSNAPDDLWFELEPLYAVEHSDELQERRLLAPHGSFDLL